MIRSLLIANRGEIAVRIIRTCRDMGIRSVAVYSTVDNNSMHVQMADEAVCIGGPQSAESYLNSNNIITAACLKRCDAIHPGVGFLAENAHFAESVEKAGLIFVGPKPETIALLGDKIQAKRLAKEAQIPVTDGNEMPIEGVQEALRVAQAIGYPVILKAAAGGGGRGMRIVEHPRQMAELFPVAVREATAFFANGSILMERYLTMAKHIEVQLVADGSGSVLCFGERDCSVQQRHQKLIEESPAAKVDRTLIEHMVQCSRDLFSRIGYRGAGTVEYLVSNGSYYFMEVNSRLQVEHPVSEAVSSSDLVRLQLLVASGIPLSTNQSEILLTGHALECRINAISTGKITRFVPPLGPYVRVDTHLYDGMEVGPYYDHLLAKIIVHAPTRNQSIATMKRALQELVVEGLSTNQKEQLAIIDSPQFKNGAFDTGIYRQTIEAQSCKNT